jgi:hypothetical protein
MIYAINEDRFGKPPDELAEIDALNESLRATAPEHVEHDRAERDEQLDQLARDLSTRPDGGFL